MQTRKTRLPKSSKAVNPSREGLSIYKGQTPTKSECWVWFQDGRGRQCMIILIALGEEKDPYGYAARLAVDDGKVYDNTYIGKIAYPAPTRRNEVAAGFVHGECDTSWVKTPDDMRDCLIAKAKSVAETLDIPIPLPKGFMEG